MLCYLPKVTQHLGGGPIGSDPNLRFSVSKTRSPKWLGDRPSLPRFLSSGLSRIMESLSRGGHSHLLIMQSIAPFKLQ